jgi:hypothetical protein
VDYGGVYRYDKIFIPTLTNAFGAETAKNIDLILGPCGADGVYWDEMEYSVSEYHDGEPWDGVSGDIDTTKPFYLQVPGTYTSDCVPYVGHMWYVFELDVPKKFAGKSIRLYAPTVSSEAWVWVNGEYAGNRKRQEGYIRPVPLGLDVTSQIKPGKNIVGVWINTGQNRTQVAEGFLGRLFLWSSK